MNRTDQLIQIINTALVSSDNKVRSQAEGQIISYRDANPTQFFLSCAQIISEQQKQIIVRQQTGTVASRLLNMKNNNNGKYYWDQLHPQDKQSFKNKILNVLISPSSQVMKAGATILAVIASIQLPRGQWQNIIDLLAQHCTNQDLNIKVASITTLGYICQQIKKAGQLINERLSQQILGSIIVGTRQPQQNIVQTSLKALQDSLSFLESLMSHSRYRDAVFDVFTNNFKNQVQVQNTYHAMYEFVKSANLHLNNHRKALIDLTQAHLQRRDNITTMNLQLWQIIGTQYAQKITKQMERVGQSNLGQNFLQSVSEQVLPDMMKCLLVLSPNELDQDDMRMSACRAIESFMRVCDKRVLDRITSSVATIIGSEDPNHQQATVILFSTICEYPDRPLITDLFVNGFQHLFGLLNSSSQIVVKNTLIGFLRLTESLPEVVLIHKNVSQIFSTFYNFLVVDHPEIRFIAAQIFSNISEGLKENPQPVCDDPNILLTRIVKFYADNLIKLHNQQPEVNEKLTSIIMNIVMNTNKRDVIVQLIDFMIDQYYQITNQVISNPEILIEQTLSVLHTAILAHKNAVPNNQILGRICDLLNSHFKKFGVQQQGLALLGATATTFSKTFESRVVNYLNYINHGLNGVNEIQTFKAALSCIGDLARMMESSFFNNATKIMKKLLQYIQSDLDRQLKLSIIGCMGDLILSMQQFGQTFLDQILHITDICFQAVYQLTNNQKDLDYVEQLKSNLIQMYSCLVFAINGPRPNKKLFEHFGNLATFVVRTCAKNLHPTIDYLRTCLYLIYDSAAFYWNVPAYMSKVKQITQSKQIGELVQLISKFSNRPQIKQFLDFIRQRQRM